MNQNNESVPSVLQSTLLFSEKSNELIHHIRHGHTTMTYHAHWDCSLGATVSCLLGSCLDAGSLSQEKVKELWVENFGAVYEDAIIVESLVLRQTVTTWGKGLEIEMNSSKADS